MCVKSLSTKCIILCTIFWIANLGTNLLKISYNFINKINLNLYNMRCKHSKAKKGRGWVINLRTMSDHFIPSDFFWSPRKASPLWDRLLLGHHYHHRAVSRCSPQTENLAKSIPGVTHHCIAQILQQCDNIIRLE